MAELGCQRVRIGCSPFWRCLETSSAIAKALGVNNVTLEYEFGEVLLDYLYEENPVPHLKTNQTLDLGNGITFEQSATSDWSCLGNEFPETWFEFQKRFEAGVKLVKDRLNAQTEQVEAEIMVCHGAQQEVIPMFC